MSLHIYSSARYLKVGNRVIDKITDEYNPPRYWFRLKVCAKRAHHKEVKGSIENLWWGNYRQVKNFDPLMILWLNEPLQFGEANDKIAVKYFKPDIAPGQYEMAGLIHAKLPMKPVDPNEELLEENIPDEQLPEVEVNQSLSEAVHIRKRRLFNYGTYYAKIVVADKKGHKGKRIFKVWAYRDPKKCKIRHARFYEKWLLNLKKLLPPL